MTPANQQLPSWVWVSTPCAAVLIRCIWVFVPRLLELKMYGNISSAGMRTYPPWGELAPCTIPSQSAIGQWDWDFHTVRGGFDPGDHHFCPNVV